MCVLIVNTNFVWKISQSKRIQRDIILNLHMQSTCYSFLSDINQQSFLDRYQISWK